jgi:hypothetical protein
VAVTARELPADPELPISEEVRQRGIELAQELHAVGKLGLDQFHLALDRLLAVRTEPDFVAVIRSLPPPVEFTPPALRRQEPFEISVGMSEVRLEGRWQVGRATKISTGMGSVTIDLTQAEFDEWDVEIVVHTGMGEITVIAPRGFDIRQVGRSGAITTVIEPPIPGFPVVRLSATSDMGTIRIAHQAAPAQLRRRWHRRHRPALPPGSEASGS